MARQISYLRSAVAVSACFLLWSGVTPFSFAADGPHGAHRHGVSKLKLVIEGKRLEIELESPGSDIVGFEHAPASDADRKAISDAAARLKNSGVLFAVSAAAGCSLASVEVEAPGIGETEKHDDHSHKHDHGHRPQKAAAEAHSEFHAYYRFDCRNPGELTHIDIGFFAAFPRAHEIDVQAVTPERQFRRELTAADSRLTF